MLNWSIGLRIDNEILSNSRAEYGAEIIENILLSWIFKSGRYETGWRMLEKGLCGLAALTIMKGNNQDLELKIAISSKLSNAEPSQEIRDRVAKAILERRTRFQQAHWSSNIEVAIEQVDQNKLHHLLEEVAKLLSPNTAY